jgi:hypothetical protein
MILLALTAVIGFFTLPLWIGLAAAAGYLFFLLRLIARHVNFSNVEGFSGKLLMIGVYALLPWLHTYRLFRCYWKLWLGKDPV